MKKVILISIALSIPLFLSFQVWIVLRYQELKENVSKLEAEQEEWLEKNKHLLSEISAYRSPQRLEQEATNKLGLSSLKPDQIMKIELSGTHKTNNANNTNNGNKNVNHSENTAGNNDPVNHNSDLVQSAGGEAQ